MTKITLDSISRADLHKLVDELQKQITELEMRVDRMQDLVTKLAVRQGE